MPLPCVMRSNIHELDRLIEFANSLEAKVHFNIVWNPEHESLRFLPAASLKQILMMGNAKEIAFPPPIALQNTMPIS